jgi:hypothetical protein
MVRKRTENGGWYNEPPYTEEEEDMLYKMSDYGNGPITILHAEVPAPQPKGSPRPPARRSRRS